MGAIRWGLQVRESEHLALVSRAEAAEAVVGELREELQEAQVRVNFSLPGVQLFLTGQILLTSQFFLAS